MLRFRQNRKWQEEPTKKWREMGTQPTTVAYACKRFHLMVRVQFTHRVLQRFFASKCSQWTHNILLLSSGWEFFFFFFLAPTLLWVWFVFFRLYGIRVTTGGVYPLKTQATGNTHTNTSWYLWGEMAFSFSFFLKCHLYYQWKDAASVWGCFYSPHWPWPEAPKSLN